MTEKRFSVEELARLCGVDRETIRRWRSKGVRGVYLEATDETALRGKPISFTAEAIRRFGEANPRIMTAALEKALGEASFPESGTVPENSVFSYRTEEQEFLKKILAEKRASLLRELAQTEEAMSRLEEKGR